MSYDRAITEMKRMFIRSIQESVVSKESRGLRPKTVKKKLGVKYSNPFFWAPFVYYGK